MVRASVRVTRRVDPMMNGVDKSEDTIVVEEDGGLFGSLGSKHLFLQCGAKRQLAKQAGPVAEWARLWKDAVDVGRRPDIPGDMSDVGGVERQLRKLLCEVIEQAGLGFVTVEAKPTKGHVPEAHRETYWGRHVPFGFIYSAPFLCGYKAAMMCQAFGWPTHAIVMSTERGEVSDYYTLPNKLREAIECPMDTEDLLVFRAYVAAVYLQHILSTVHCYRKQGVVEQLATQVTALRQAIGTELASRYGKREAADSA